MNCEQIRESIPLALAGQLDKPGHLALVEHLETCPGCRTEMAELNAVWRVLETVYTPADSAPGSAARSRFQHVLEAYRAGMEDSRPATRPDALPGRAPWLRPQPVWQLAAAAGLLCAGILLGRYLPSASPAGNSEMAQLRAQVENLHQMVALSMLQQQSPSARMRGVAYSEQFAPPDPRVIDALLQAVNRDANVNVRLSAVDALQKLAAGTEVARAMVDSIPAQDSPLVQISLIDTLVQRDARAIAPDLERIARDERFDETVRQRARWALHKWEVPQP